jgi:hypothetical protein
MADRFLEGLIWFFQPLLEAVGDEVALRNLFLEFGYDIDGPAAASALQEIGTALDPVVDGLVGALDAGALDPAAAIDVFTALAALSDSAAIQTLVADAAEFGHELFDYLVYRYLATQVYPASAAMKALGVVGFTTVQPTDPGGRDILYRRVEMRWGRLRDFIRDNGTWARDVYGWGAAFDHATAIKNLALIVESTQLGLSRRRALPAPEADAFLANNGGAPVEEITVPFFQTELASIDADGSPTCQNEVGLKVVPSGDLARPEELGLAIAPYTAGTLANEIALTEKLALAWSVASAAAGGAYLRFSPAGIEVVQGGAVDAGFELGFVYATPDATPMLLAGDPGGTRLEAGALLTSVGGDLNGDVYFAGGVNDLRTVIDVSGDGFLGAIIPAPIVVDVGAIALGWRNGRGVYFDSGTSLAVTVPLHLPLGPITVHQFGIELEWETQVEAAFLITADATLGPLFAYVENAGIVVTVLPAPAGDGLLGQADLAFGFRPPTGYAAALEAPPIVGGGFLSVGEDEYRGALALSLGDIGFSAFAILNTKLPGGRDGFSFVASIFGEFTLPLGYGFFLTGVGGIIGINRTIDTQAMREVLYDGRFDNLLFPDDPIANAATILEDMAAIFPSCEGQHLFGPVARLAYSQPPLISGTLGVVLEVGATFRLLILGGIASVLPDENVALIDLRLSFFGEIDFAAGTVSFDATLQGSRVLLFPVAGDIAARTGWAPGMDHVMAFGGLHPSYPKPSNLPDLRRMSISFGTNNPRVTLKAYQAITLNSLQFGASASLYAKGPDVPALGQVAAEGNIGFDALITFNPFAFDVDLGGSLSVLVDGDVTAGLGFDLRLRGPNTFRIDGKAWVTVMGFDVEFPIRHTWGTPQSIPPAIADPVALLIGALQDSDGFESVADRHLSSGVAFASVGRDERRPADPAGGLRVVQKGHPARDPHRQGGRGAARRRPRPLRPCRLGHRGDGECDAGASGVRPWPLLGAHGGAAVADAGVRATSGRPRNHQ